MSRPLLLKRTLQAAASRVSGSDLSTLNTTTISTADTSAQHWDVFGWQQPLTTNTSVAPASASKQQPEIQPSTQNQSLSTGPVQEPQAWAAQAGISIPEPQQARAPAMVAQQPSSAHNALLASLLSQKVPAEVAQALQQVPGKKSSTASIVTGSNRRLAAQQPPLVPAQRNVAPRGNARSITLNKDITATNTIDQLLALVTLYGDEFDFFNISTAISRLPKLVGDHAQHGMSSRHHGDHEGKASASSAHLSAAVKDLADRLCGLALLHVHEFDGRGLANTAWAFAKLRYVPDPALPAALCRAAVSRIDQFAAQNVSNLAWALVYLHYVDEQLLHLLKRKACEQVYEMKPQELANMMWALASHEQLDEQTAQVLGQRAARLAMQFKEQELSNVVWAMGRSGHGYDPALLGPLLVVVRSKLGSFMPQGISNMVWALGQLGHHDPDLLAALARECPTQLHAYDAQALSNLATGLAALAHPATQGLMVAVVNEAASRGARMAPQHMAAVLNAGVTLNIQNDRLLGAAVDVLHTRASNLESTTLATLAGAAVTLQAHLHPPSSSAAALLAPLGNAVLGCIDKLHGQALASLVVHYTKLDTPATSDVLPALLTRLPAALPTLNAQQAAMVMQALQAAGVLTAEVAPALLRQASTPTVAEGQEAQEHDYADQLATTLATVARMGFTPPYYMQEALMAQVQNAMPHMSVEQLCSSCWSLAAMGVLETQTLQSFSALLEGHIRGGALDRGEMGRLQLQQVFDAHVLVTTQLSQRLGRTLNAIPPGLVPVMPPYLEQAIAAHNQMLLQRAAALPPPPPPPPPPAVPVQRVAAPTAQMANLSPFAAAAVQNVAPPPRTSTDSTLGTLDANVGQAIANMANINNPYDVGAAAVMAATRAAMAAKAHDDSSASLSRARPKPPPRPVSSFNGVGSNPRDRTGGTPSPATGGAAGAATRAGVADAAVEVRLPVLGQKAVAAAAAAAAATAAAAASASTGVWVGGLGSGDAHARPGPQQRPTPPRPPSSGGSSVAPPPRCTTPGTTTASDVASNATPPQSVVLPLPAGVALGVPVAQGVTPSAIHAALGAVMGLPLPPGLVGRTDSLEEVAGGWYLPRDLLSAAPSAAGPVPHHPASATMLRDEDLGGKPRADVAVGVGGAPKQARDEGA